MDDPLFVRGAERAADLIGDLARLDRREHVARDAVVQGLAGQELHDEVGLPVGGLAEVHDLDDVLVSDGVDRARLVEEAGDHLGIARQRQVQELDRDLASDHRMLGLVHHPHPALTQLPGDPVVPDRRPDQAQKSNSAAMPPEEVLAVGKTRSPWLSAVLAPEPASLSR